VGTAAEPNLLWRHVVRSQKSGDGCGVIAFEDVAMGDVKEKLASPPDETGWQSIRIDLVTAAHRVAAVV
jgi:hypothetical protein